MAQGSDDLSTLPLNGKLHSKIISSDVIRFFSIESDGEGLRLKFEREDSQTDSEKKKKKKQHVRAFVTSVAPPRNHARSCKRIEYVHDQPESLRRRPAIVRAYARIPQPQILDARHQ